jgi:hypothetical protein
VATEDLHPRQSPAQCSRLRPGRWCRSTVEDPDPATDSQKKKVTLAGAPRDRYDTE